MFDVCLVASPGAIWEQQWSYLLSHFAPRRLYVIGELDRRVRPFTEYLSVESAKEIEPELVLLAPQSGRYVQGTQSLSDFVHPDDCCYLFGADNQFMTTELLGREPDHAVYIPTSTTDTMYSFMAGAVTLWDRVMKHG